ncbi:glycosyltransferase [Planococcus sp. ISL-109]|uniref:glycosyltransferase n=1 Tax=Planococcus sp. ISL-109 TaxID=2819166 RepID=UPI001BE8952F|nr:glycosyltransferase [Planococcus sp. ISL-109]MBT2581241.1 glycosyltransferase [Planococcus sp. ISL-109]
MIPFETINRPENQQPGHIRKIALVHKHMKAGGIEALIVRMARWLSSNGYSVSVYLYSSGGPLLRHLQQIDGLEIIVRDNGKEPPIDLSVLKRLVRAEKYDLVYSFSPSGLLLSYAIPAHVRLSGVYQPETYKLERNRKVIRAIRAFDKNFHQKLVFMNPTVRRYSARALAAEMPEQFMPLPVEQGAEDQQLGSPHSRRIVSVGAIQQFSTHYAQVIELMEELIQIDPEFNYHIFGEGPDEARLQKSIAESDARDHIFLHPMPRNGMVKCVLEDSFCFIGSGAVMIQACGSGIPGITSRTNDADALSEGYFHNLPPYEIGESFWEAPETYEIGELVKNLLVSENVYRKVAERCKQKARRFEIDAVMGDFLQLAEGKLAAN